jgi:fluoride ion exporter CrcB/FEX
MDLGVGVLALMVVGSFIIGFIVMWIAFLFIAREKEFTAAEFGGFISAFFGGAILTVYTTQLTSETQWIFWIYPIGLGVGMICYRAWGGTVDKTKGAIKVGELIEYQRKK